MSKSLSDSSYLNGTFEAMCNECDTFHASKNYHISLEFIYKEKESLSAINRFKPYRSLISRSRRPVTLEKSCENYLSTTTLKTSNQPLKQVKGQYMKKNKKHIDITKILNNPVVVGAEAAVAAYCVNKFKANFIVKSMLRFDESTYKNFLTWLKKYDKNFNKHLSKNDYKPYYEIKDADFFIAISDKEYTFARIVTGQAITNNLNEFDKLNNHGEYITPYNVDVYVFGKEAKEVGYELTKLTKTEKLVYYTITSVKRGGTDRGRTEIYRDLSAGRRKESVFLNDNVKETILNHVQKFFDNKSIYNKRNLIYKTGILLYGEPGTGKSTIANMIATEFNCHMVLIKMNEFADLDIDYITSMINADNETYIVVLEDIDCVIGNRESENEDLENKKNVNKLLQFLDSTSSPSNVVFVATTNHIEKLDSAILRDGRFDLKINIDNIDMSAATQMCNSFGIENLETVKRIFKENSVNGKINPAKLQNLILKEIK